MRRLTIVSSLLLTTLLIVDHGASLPTAQGQDASLGDSSVKLLLPHSKGNTGDTVPAEIRFQDAVDVGALQMALLYDETLLEVVSVDQGALLGKNAIF